MRGAGPQDGTGVLNKARCPQDFHDLLCPQGARRRRRVPAGAGARAKSRPAEGYSSTAPPRGARYHFRVPGQIPGLGFPWGRPAAPWDPEEDKICPAEVNSAGHQGFACGKTLGTPARATKSRPMKSYSNTAPRAALVTIFAYRARYPVLDSHGTDGPPHGDPEEDKICPAEVNSAGHQGFACGKTLGTRWRADKVKTDEELLQYGGPVRRWLPFSHTGPDTRS